MLLIESTGAAIYAQAMKMGVECSPVVQLLPTAWLCVEYSVTQPSAVVYVTQPTPGLHSAIVHLGPTLQAHLAELFGIINTLATQVTYEHTRNPNKQSLRVVLGDVPSWVHCALGIPSDTTVLLLCTHSNKGQLSDIVLEGVTEPDATIPLTLNYNLSGFKLNYL